MSNFQCHNARAAEGVTGTKEGVGTRSVEAGGLAAVQWVSRTRQPGELGLEESWGRLGGEGGQAGGRQMTFYKGPP